MTVAALLPTNQPAGVLVPVGPMPSKFCDNGVPVNEMVCACAIPWRAQPSAADHRYLLIELLITFGVIVISGAPAILWTRLQRSSWPESPFEYQSGLELDNRI